MVSPRRFSFFEIYAARYDPNRAGEPSRNLSWKSVHLISGLTASLSPAVRLSIMKNAHSSISWDFRRFVRTLCSVLFLFLLGTYGQGTLAQSSPHSGGWVVIGVKEYQALRTKAFPEQI